MSFSAMASMRSRSLSSRLLHHHMDVQSWKLKFKIGNCGNAFGWIWMNWFILITGWWCAWLLRSLVPPSIRQKPDISALCKAKECYICWTTGVAKAATLASLCPAQKSTNWCFCLFFRRQYPKLMMPPNLRNEIIVLNAAARCSVRHCDLSWDRADLPGDSRRWAKTVDPLMAGVLWDALEQYQLLVNVSHVKLGRPFANLANSFWTFCLVAPWQVN